MRSGRIAEVNTAGMIFLFKNILAVTILVVVLAVLAFFALGVPVIPEVVVSVFIIGAALLLFYMVVLCTLMFIAMLRVVSLIDTVVNSELVSFVRELAVWIPAFRAVLGTKWVKATEDMTDDERELLLRTILKELKK